MNGLLYRNFDRNSPWSTLDSWTKDFDRYFNLYEPSHRRENWSSACDIHETDSEFLLSLDLPGVAKDDIHIDQVGNTITISAERKQEQATQNSFVHKVERGYGATKRSFTLPDLVDTNMIHAQYENGVLYLSIPKAEEKKAKRIQVQSGSKEGFFDKLMGKSPEVEVHKGKDTRKGTEL